MGNDDLVKVNSIGDVYLEMSSGLRLVLKDGKYIPNIRLNLISAGKLEDDGYGNTFSNGQWELT